MRKCTSLEELKPQLTLLMKEYNFSAVEIYLNTLDKDVPFFTHDPDTAARTQNPLILSFPINRGDRAIGYVYISREMGGDHFLCTTELVRAISEELSRLI